MLGKPALGSLPIGGSEHQPAATGGCPTSGESQQPLRHVTAAGLRDARGIEEGTGSTGKSQCVPGPD